VKASTKASVGALKRPAQGLVGELGSGIERPGLKK